MMEDNYNCSSPIYQYQKDTILCILGGLSIAAVVTCITGLSIIYCTKLRQQFIHRLVSYQLIGASVFSTAIGSQLLLLRYSPSKYPTLCVVEGFLLTYTTWLKLLFLTCLMLHLFLHVCCFVKYRRRLEVMYIVVPILAPLLVSFIPFIHHSYGIAGAWCWIKGWYHNCPAENYNLGIWFQYGVFYVPVLAGQLITIALLISAVSVIVTMVRMTIERMNSERRPLLNQQHQIKNVYSEVIPLVPYPIIFLCLLIPPFVNRIINQTSDTANYGAFIASAISIPCWGLFSGITSLVHTIIVLVMHHRNRSRENPTCVTDLEHTPNESSTTVQSTTHLPDHTTNRGNAARDDEVLTGEYNISNIDRASGTYTRVRNTVDISAANTHNY